MGYRSRVAIATTEELARRIGEAWHDAGGLDDYGIGRSRDGEACYLVWDEVKWNSSFPEVLAVETMLQDDEAPHGEPWCFVRVGEEVGDFEQLWSDNCPDDLYIYPDQVITLADGQPLSPDFDRPALDDLIMALFLDVQLRDPKAARAYRDSNHYLDKLCKQRGEA